MISKDDYLSGHVWNHLVISSQVFPLRFKPKSQKSEQTQVRRRYHFLRISSTN